MGDQQVILCPVCLKTLPFDAGVISREDYINIHFATDCKPQNYTKAKAKSQGYVKQKIVKPD